jgi:hypothetical protein
MESAAAPQPDRPTPQPRRPYEPPTIAWEEDFLPYAYASCTKMAGGFCNIRRRS